MVVKKRIVIVDGQDMDVTHDDSMIKQSSDVEGMFVYFGQDIERAAKELVGEAQKDPISYDAALHLAAKAILQGDIVPEPLRQLASDHLKGIVSRPTSSGRYPQACLQRDQLIAQLIKDIVDATGLKPTSGKRSYGQSACNAVAEGFGHLGLQPDSYESIIKIWGNRRKLLVRGTDHVV